MKEPIFKIKTQAPSNIALIKYWGKHGDQLPINPSLSMTLSHCYTQTQLEIFESGSQDIQVKAVLKDDQSFDFSARIKKYLEKLSTDYPDLRNKKYRISTVNTFPHSSGIASSASGFAALALGIFHFLKSLGVDGVEDVTSLARRGSGSAARSFRGPYVSWGAESLETAYLEKFHENLIISDIIVLVEQGQKAISSSQGHSLMSSHHFKTARIKKARERFDLLKKAISKNNWKAIGEIAEQEALELHALMMTSDNGFWLIKPTTLEIMNWVREQRSIKSGVQVYFTLDAGANIHCLCPKSDQEKLYQLLQEKFPQFSMIKDYQGSGAIVIK